MRRIFILVALAALAWYLSNQRRRAQIQEAVQERVPPDLQNKAQETLSTLRDTATQQAQQAVQTVRQTLGDAAANVQEASSNVADRAQQAAQTATDTAQDAATTARSAVQTDVATPPPSIKETVQSELDDIGEKVDNLRAQAEAPSVPAEDSAAATSGIGVADTVTAEQAEGKGGIAPEGQHPRPVAGEGTTTPAGGAVHALSPQPLAEGQTSTGQAEPLPEGLPAGAPGTGGPQASTKAPSVRNETETPTTGMEQPEVVDRAADVLPRTSGNFIGNKTTRVFHAATANPAHLPAEENRVYFDSEEEALAAGFRPAENEGLESTDG